MTMRRPVCTFEPVFKHLPSAVCGSGDSFATRPTDMDCGVVDMEAYALAKVCWTKRRNSPAPSM